MRLARLVDLTTPAPGGAVLGSGRRGYEVLGLAYPHAMRLGCTANTYPYIIAVPSEALSAGGVGEF